MADRSARILVSSCLLGQPVRYDGKAKKLQHVLLEQWRAEGRLVAFCPEVAAGLPTPRPPAELEPDSAAKPQARILDATGNNLSKAFYKGAELALAKAQQSGCQFALLTDGSPSCGSTWVYDGHFTGTKRIGQGVVAAYLQQHGLQVFDEARIEELAARIEGHYALA